MMILTHFTVLSNQSHVWFAVAYSKVAPDLGLLLELSLIEVIEENLEWHFHTKQPLFTTLIPFISGKWMGLYGKALLLSPCFSWLPGSNMLWPRCVRTWRVPLHCGMGRSQLWEPSRVLHGPVFRARDFPPRYGDLQLWPQLDWARLLHR